MQVTEKREYDIRVGFTESEFKAIQNFANVLGFSSTAGFIRYHLSKALINCEEKVSSLSRITGRPDKCPPRAAEASRRT